MRDFFKASSFKVLVITVVVLLGIIIYTASAGGSFLANILGFVSSPMQSIATETVDGALSFVDLDGLSREELKAMISDLQAENSTLREGQVKLYDLEQENEQLKEQLNIAESAPDTEMLSASVIGRDPGDVFYGFSINKGTLAGISVGDPVITKQGLVGIVTQAYATTSKVTCILSENVKIGAICKKEDGYSESGVITSNIQTAAGGLVRMDYLSNETKIEPGDIIVTSGSASIYPENLIIGSVQSVEKSENDISCYAVVKPYEDIRSVKEVHIILNFPGKGEEREEIPPVVSGDPQNNEDAEAGK